MKIVNKTKFWLALTLAFLISSASAFGFALNVSSQISDGNFGAYNTREGVAPTASTAAVITGTTNGNSYLSAVYIFKMPSLAPWVDFAYASLNITSDFTVGSPGPVDLVGIRVSTSGSPFTSDFDSGPAVTILSGVTDGNFTIGNNNITLNTWINDNYAADSYLIFGVRTQTQPALGNYMNLDANAILTIVPEAGSYALIIGSLALGFVMMVRRHKG